MISPDETHDELISYVQEIDLPELYGGVCECEATCIYSDKGPWCDFENKVNYREPKSAGSDDMDERQLKSLKQQFKMHEEFKMEEDDDDMVDLLDEKAKSKDLSEFYA